MSLKINHSEKSPHIEYSRGSVKARTFLHVARRREDGKSIEDEMAKTNSLSQSQHVILLPSQNPMQQGRDEEQESLHSHRNDAHHCRKTARKAGDILLLSKMISQMPEEFFLSRRVDSSLTVSA
jgi:hypothetical protein